eukprot:9999877-Lingulodinium_polyedra.AAC.1
MTRRVASLRGRVQQHWPWPGIRARLWQKLFGARPLSYGKQRKRLTEAPYAVAKPFVEFGDLAAPTLMK